MSAKDKANSHRLRTGRYSISQQVYLITITTHDRLPVFTDFNLARLIVGELKTAHEEGAVSSMAWVVMPDHLHWLAQLQTASLDGLLQRIKGRS